MASIRARAPAPHEAGSPAPMDTSGDDEIGKHFPDVTDSSLIMRLQQLCRTHNLTAEKLAEQWELVCLNDTNGSGMMKMSMDTLTQLERRCAAASAKPSAGSSSFARLQASRAPKPVSTFTKDTAHRKKEADQFHATAAAALQQ